MELAVVADPTDRLAAEVVQLAKEQGRIAKFYTVFEAAQFFSIHVHLGQATVEPDIPLFLRFPPQPILRNSFDASFHYGECFATLWAAAALSKSTVINRPSVNGFIGRLSHSVALTELRAGCGGALEVFAKSAPPPREDRKQETVPLLLEGMEQRWYIQDLSTYRTTAWPDIPEGSGPYRARWASTELAYEVVAVLGSNAWRCTTVPLDHLELEQKSIFLLKQLELFFGTVIWSISQDLKSATLARVNSFPTMDQVQFVWTSLGPALLKEFFS